MSWKKICRTRARFSWFPAAAIGPLEDVLSSKLQAMTADSSSLRRGAMFRLEAPQRCESSLSNPAGLRFEITFSVTFATGRVLVREYP